MVTAHLISATLASLAQLLRSAPAAGEAQAATLEHLTGLAGNGAPLVITAGLESLIVNDTPVRMDMPGATLLNELMLLQGIHRVTFSTPLAADRVIGFCSVLAAFPGTFESFAEVREAAGATEGSGLVLAEAPSEMHFERFATEGPILDEMAGSAAIDRDATIHLAEDGGLLQYPELGELLSYDSPASGTEELLPEELVFGPHARFSERLSSILERGRLASRTENWDELLRVALEVIEIEAEAPTEAIGKALSIELRRLLPRRELTQIARLASAGGRKQDAIAILRKVGAESTEVLMDLLVDEMSLAGRRGYFSALTHMAEGHDVIIAHLQHQTWYVARNAAELCGEMDLEGAVPELVKLAGHPDGRVRRSVAGALAKIGTPMAMEPLRTLLRDEVAAVRLRAVAALNPRRARGIVMPVARMLEQETEPEIVKAATTSLGRIGTPDALQALAAYARAPKRLLGLGGRPGELRALAVDALGAAGSAAVPLLRAFAGDDDATVQHAARDALTRLGAWPATAG
jgi:HEAT repeat protein